MNIKIFTGLLNKFILWLKEIFFIHPKTKYEKKELLTKALPNKESIELTLPSEKKSVRTIPEEGKQEESLSAEEKPTEVPVSVGRTTEILSEEKIVEITSTKEKAQEVPTEQEIPSELPSKASEEKILTSESEEGGKTKTQKPCIKKPPTEERKKEHRKRSGEEERRAAITKPKTEIDLGKRMKPRPIKQRQPQMEVNIESTDKTPEQKEIPTRVESPNIEINLDEAKVSFIIPEQLFKTIIVDNIPQELDYKLELNGDEQTISAKVSSDKQNLATVEEKRIDLERPLKNFKVVYPDELQGRVYNYQHSNEILYPFIAIGNNRGRMHYLYDNEGKINPLPNRDIWILLKEDFDLATEPDVIEDRWFWEKYRPMHINLKNTNELVIKKRQTGEEYKKIPCKTSFSVVDDKLLKDDFKEQSPLFVGKTVKIKAPMENPSGWIVWIQNKQAGYKIITENWTGDEPLELKIPDDLPCECGEFQVDICKQEDRIPIETLFFRYIPSLQLKFPRELITPEPNIGHKKEIIKILLERDFQDWELKPNENVECMRIENGYQVELLPEQDALRFSLMKKGKPETETSLHVTIPRLKWKTSINKTWCDKSQQIKRDELIPGTDFYLTACTNDFDRKYDISAILETNGQKLQEEKFIRKGIVHNLLLNKFYDTIKKNEDKITLRIEIRKAKTDEMLGQANVIHLPEITKEKILDKPFKKAFPKARGGNGRMRKGRGFSRQEIIKAGIDMDDIRRLVIPFDKRRKSAHSENTETLKSLTGGK